MKKNKKQPRLSKSRFVTGLQCLKRLYLASYHSDMAKETDEGLQAIFDQGHEIGVLATKVFPDGVQVEEDYLHPREAVEHTRKLIADKNVPVIYEAAFVFDNIIVRIDILKRLPRNRWHLIEVKSTASVKDHHVPDVAIQKYVASQCGIKVSKASLMHLNRAYVYDGKNYEIKKLFTVSELKDELKKFEKELPDRLAEQWDALSKSKAPEIEPGGHCTAPYVCDFYSVCNREEQHPADWVGNLPKINSGKVEELLSQGIESVHDIPDDFALTDTQNRAKISLQKNKVITEPGIKEELKQLPYPLIFMDFETINPALPRYKGMHPYDMMTFQWSVHVKKDRSSKPEHYEFLHDEDSDPREGFIISLLEVLEKYKNAYIVVYNQSFESSRLSELAGWYPTLSKRIERVRDCLWDLLPVIRNNVYHPDFYGSFSLKGVLPALISNMSYEGMEVSDGTEAGIAYGNLIRGGLPPKERKKLKSEMLKYCGQDTLATVKLIDLLQKG